MADLKILQLGCGSMGSRRLRDLSRRPGVALRLFDQREDRRLAARDRFGVEAFPSLDAALDWAPDALVISTPPGTKGPFVQRALDLGIHHFVEADIWSYGAAARADGLTGVVSAPSLTFAFLPVVQALAGMIREIGTLLAYQFMLTGDMAAWHPMEGREYYGRHRDTAPAREMVPFELAWLASLFGRPRSVSGRYGRFSGKSDSFEDTWSLQLALAGGGTGQLTVTMASPENFRGGCAFGTAGGVRWDVNRGEIVLLGGRRPEPRPCGEIGQVIEAAYAAEINRYVDAIHGGPPWPHRYSDYQLAIATLAAAETSAELGGWVAVDPDREPARVLPALPA